MRTMNVAIFIIHIILIMIAVLFLRYLISLAKDQPNEPEGYYISCVIVLLAIIAISFNAYRHVVKSIKTTTINQTTP